MILKKWNYNSMGNEETESEEKVFQSCHTTTPSEFKKSFGKKLLGLTNCPSYKSYKASISETDHNSDLKLISKYLLATTEQQKLLLFREMQEQYKLVENSETLIDGKVQKQQKMAQDQIMEYFIGVYLNSMGYAQEANKKYILSRIKMHLGMETIKYANFLYKNLFKNILPEPIRRQQLLNTCRKGWEYFIKLMLKILDYQRQAVLMKYAQYSFSLKNR